MTRGSIARLCAFAVLLFQVQLALHSQLQHEFADLDEGACEICHSLEQGGNAPHAAGTQSLDVAHHATVSEPQGIMLIQRSIERYAPRAPPLV